MEKQKSMRSIQGKYMATTAPFGYQKDEKDHNHLVIDEVTAPVAPMSARYYATPSVQETSP